MVGVSGFPKLPEVRLGDLVPLSDFGRQGAAHLLQSVGVHEPVVRLNIKIRNGDLYIAAISSGPCTRREQGIARRPKFLNEARYTCLGFSMQFAFDARTIDNKCRSGSGPRARKRK